MAPEAQNKTPDDILNFLVQNGWEEQIMASLLMCAQRDKLPAEMVQPHIDLLQYWGLIGQVITNSNEIPLDKQ